MNIFLDSGAFGSWKRGVDLDLSEYIAYIRQNLHHIENYVTLDVIPGHDGQRAVDPEAIERAANRSHVNHCRMKDAGLSPIPVFHRGEDFKWLATMIEDREPYIALAPLPWGSPPLVVARWTDDCFSFLTDRHGRTTAKVHGLAVTSSFLLSRHPWFSVDSTSWVKNAGFGKVPMPLYRNDVPDYAYRPEVVAVTDWSSGDRNHIDRLGDIDLDCLRHWLNQHAGVALEQVRNSVHHRRLAWVRFFQGVESTRATRIVFGTNTSYAHAQALGNARCLLSFYDLCGHPNRLADYVAGRPPARPQPPPEAWSRAYIEQRKLAHFEQLQEWEGAFGKGDVEDQ